MTTTYYPLHHDASYLVLQLSDLRVNERLDSITDTAWLEAYMLLLANQVKQDGRDLGINQLVIAGLGGCVAPALWPVGPQTDAAGAVLAAVRVLKLLFDELRDQFLTRTALSADHDGGVGGGHLLGQLYRLLEGGRHAQQGHRFAGAVLNDQTRLYLLRVLGAGGSMGRPADEQLQMRRREWLGEIVPGPCAQRFDAAGYARITRHYQYDHVLMGFDGGFQDLHARDRRHVEVHQHHVELAPLQQVNGFFTAAGGGDYMAIHLQHRRAAISERPIVVDHEDAEPVSIIGNSGRSTIGEEWISHCVWRRAGANGRTTVRHFAGRVWTVIVA